MSGGSLRSRRRFWSPVTDETTGSAVPDQVRREALPAAVPKVPGLRRRRPRDLAPCARLLRVVHYESGYPVSMPEAPRSWLADTDELGSWVVERQDEILGHVALSRVGHDSVSAYRWREMTGREPSELAAVTRLFVRPRARRQGLGTALLETAVEAAHARGLTVVLQVASTQQDAIRLYQAQDWRLLSMDLWGARTERRRMHCYVAPPAR
jgi:ribosomal protein S18 acetylase RimI-like enzyme